MSSPTASFITRVSSFFLVFFFSSSKFLFLPSYLCSRSARDHFCSSTLARAEQQHRELASRTIVSPFARIRDAAESGKRAHGRIVGLCSSALDSVCFFGCVGVFFFFVFSSLSFFFFATRTLAKPSVSGAGTLTLSRNSRRAALRRARRRTALSPQCVCVCVGARESSCHYSFPLSIVHSTIPRSFSRSRLRDRPSGWRAPFLSGRRIKKIHRFTFVSAESIKFIVATARQKPVAEFQNNNNNRLHDNCM